MRYQWQNSPADRINPGGGQGGMGNALAMLQLQRMMQQGRGNALGGMVTGEPAAQARAAATYGAGMPEARNALATGYTPSVDDQDPRRGMMGTGASTPAPVNQDEVFSAPGLNIRYAGNPDFHYGKSASANAAPFEGVVFHHTADGTDLDAMVNYGQRVDGERGGAFGYHFYIGPDGEIVQGAPLNKRTNHIRPTENVGLRNSNALGISLVGSEKGATPAQQEAALRLAEQINAQMGVETFYGHGQIQNNRQAQEGRAATEAVLQALGL